jgi:cell division protein FtsB
MTNQPRRRRTDTWNGRIKSTLGLLPWLFTFAGWGYTLGINVSRLNALETHSVQQAAKIEVLQERGAARTAELARLAQAVTSLETSIEQLRQDMREQRRANTP